MRLTLPFKTALIFLEKVFPEQVLMRLFSEKQYFIKLLFFALFSTLLNLHSNISNVFFQHLHLSFIETHFFSVLTQ